MSDERQMVESRLSDPSGSSEGACWPPVAERIRAARQRVGITESQLASALGWSTASEYADLELYDNEAFSCISVEQLAILASVAKIPLETMLFGVERGTWPERIAFGTVSEKVAALAGSEDETLDELSTRVGWELNPVIDDPRSVGKLNVVALRDICDAIATDWVAVLLWEEDCLTSA